MSDYLFAHPSFLSDAGRVLDLGGTFDGYNESPSPAEADRLAMRADWKAVGDALGEGEPCMFDGLTEGIYGLVCFCPRCSPRCGR